MKKITKNLKTGETFHYDVPLLKITAKGWEPRHYERWTGIPVLEIEADRNGQIVTVNTWNKSASKGPDAAHSDVQQYAK